MKVFGIVNTVLLSLIALFLLTWLIIKNWRSIIRFFKKTQVVRFIVNVFVPFAVPLAISIITFVPANENDKLKTSLAIALSGLAVINLFVQLGIWMKEKKETDIRWENHAAKHAFNNLFEIYANKNSQLRTAYHNGLRQGMLTDADIPYNIFDMIRKITWEFCNTVSDITDIPTKDMDGAFVYHYVYPGASKKEQTWKWVIGKGGKFKPGLNDFTLTTDSTFHYMSNNNVSVVFFNDKANAVKAQQYVCSYRDYSHDCKGSIFAAKVAFSGNDKTLCEGIVMVNTYGHQFMDNLPWQTEKELKELLQDSIFPCYSKLLTSELAMLYFRHQSEGDEKEDCKAYHNCPFSFKEKIKIHKKAYKCIVAASKKIWTRKH